MVPRFVWFAAIGAVAMTWSSLSVADEYRSDQFLGLDLSRAVLSPKPLGPANSFTPGPLDVRVDRGNAATPASAALTPEPKIVRSVPIRSERKTASVAMHHVVRSDRAIRSARAQMMPLRHVPRTALTLHGRNPIDAQAADTRVQVWPCKSGGICNWKR